MSRPLESLENTYGPRLRDALQRLAESHEPQMRPTGELGSPRPHRRRMLMTVAAAITVVVGIGGLIVLSGRGNAPVDDSPPRPETTGAIPSTAPSPDTSVPPAPTTSATPTTVGAGVNDGAGGLRFDRPMPDDLVAVIDPPPFPVVTPYRIPDRSGDFLNEIGSSTTVFVLDDAGSVEHDVSVIDTPIPPSFFDGLEVTEIDGRRFFVDPATQPNGGFLIGDGPVRRISASPLRADPEAVLDDGESAALLAEVAEYVDGKPLTDLEPTGRFVPVQSPAIRSVVVRYESVASEPDSTSVEVVRFSVPDPLTEQEFALIAGQYSATTIDADAPHVRRGELRESGQRTYIEQVSPTDIVAITGPPDATPTDVDTWSDGLRFVRESELDTAVTEFDSFAEGDVVARGEESWGRWQITEQVTDDERCLGFGATVWLIGSASSSSAGCFPPDDDLDGFLCVELDGRRFAGVYLGGAELGFDDPRIVSAETTTRPGPDGRNLQAFLVQTDDTGSVPDTLTVTVGGVPGDACTR